MITLQQLLTMKGLLLSSLSHNKNHGTRKDCHIFHKKQPFRPMRARFHDFRYQVGLPQNPQHFFRDVPFQDDMVMFYTFGSDSARFGDTFFSITSIEVINLKPTSFPVFASKSVTTADARRRRFSRTAGIFPRLSSISSYARGIRSSHASRRIHPWSET